MREASELSVVEAPHSPSPSGSLAGKGETGSPPEATWSETYSQSIPSRPGSFPAWLVRLGVTPYQAAWTYQDRLAAALREGRGREALILLEHPHTYTLGRARGAGHLLRTQEQYAALGAEVVQIDRGGDVTYHGPGQLVGYPIIDLSRRKRDLHRYVRILEAIVTDVLAAWGLSGEVIEGLTGVWVDGEKVAAIGIKAARWVTTHGFALNVDPDLSYFQHIVPCGISGRGVTSVSRLLGRRVAVDEAAEHAAEAVARHLALALEPIAVGMVPSGLRAKLL
ncbi:MAG: lipoyl(octanoyl) transferase [Dehalococcoidia bacterium]|nr:lipoyl(octanoyl) transferase [Dehalococcoidia bacterium]